MSTTQPTKQAVRDQEADVPQAVEPSGDPQPRQAELLQVLYGMSPEEQEGFLEKALDRLGQLDVTTGAKAKPASSCADPHPDRPEPENAGPCVVRPGMKVWAGDGTSDSYTGEVTSVTKDGCFLRVLDVDGTERGIAVGDVIGCGWEDVLVIPAQRGDRPDDEAPKAQPEDEPKPEGAVPEPINLEFADAIRGPRQAAERLRAVVDGALSLLDDVEDDDPERFSLSDDKASAVLEILKVTGTELERIHEDLCSASRPRGNQRAEPEDTDETGADDADTLDRIIDDIAETLRASGKSLLFLRAFQQKLSKSLSDDCEEDDDEPEEDDAEDTLAGRIHERFRVLGLAGDEPGETVRPQEGTAGCGLNVSICTMEGDHIGDTVSAVQVWLPEDEAVGFAEDVGRAIRRRLGMPVRDGRGVILRSGMRVTGFTETGQGVDGVVVSSTTHGCFVRKDGSDEIYALKAEDVTVVAQADGFETSEPVCACVGAA
ncbi:MAG: hypothetical protein JXQ73_02510 [Phycisphaerae bacterium]|nr:hypothetical protein [Phycisphaerae bacterium]